MSEDKRRDEIVAAVRVAMNQFGVRRLTVSDVAMEAGVSRQTIYEYFPNRAALVGAALEAGGWDLIVASESRTTGTRDPVDRLAVLIEVVLDYLTASPLWADDAKRAELVPYLSLTGSPFTTAAVAALRERLLAWWPDAAPARLQRAADTTVRTILSHGLAPEENDSRDIARELAALVSAALAA